MDMSMKTKFANDMYSMYTQIRNNICLQCQGVSRLYWSCRTFVFLVKVIVIILTLTNSVALSPRANYIDWATATCRRILVPNFVDRRVSRGQHGATPTVVILRFLDRSRYFFFQVAPQLSSRAWVDPVPDSLLLRKCGSAGNRTRDLWVSSKELWPLDHRGG
jgi:hypothetical protein